MFNLIIVFFSKARDNHGRTALVLAVCLARLEAAKVGSWLTCKTLETGNFPPKDLMTGKSLNKIRGPPGVPKGPSTTLFRPLKKFRGPTYIVKFA